MLVFRPVATHDLDQLEAFAHSASAGITNLPKNRGLLQAKQTLSIESLRKAVTKPTNESYMFILEDLENGTIIGTSAIHAQAAWNEPQYFFRIETKEEASQTLGIINRSQWIRPVIYQPSHTEVCGLYLNPIHRKGGAGRILSLSRFLFIGCFPHRFDPKYVIAEMRGVIDENDHAPFYDGLLKHFFELEFTEILNYLSSGKQFIQELLPQSSFPVDLLPKNAREVIGKAHPSSEPALALLKKEGFTFSQEVDLFDGGPKIYSSPKNIRCIRDSTLTLFAGISEEEFGEEEFLVCNGKIDFRACATRLSIDHRGHIYLPQKAAEALEIKTGMPLRYVSLRPKKDNSIRENKHSNKEIEA
ncbi:MAG: hypothetical protein CMO81_01110 [Waddliaceae bacterium]|nr:hypothetical protein [Waddliaceae bacterium]